MSRWHSASPGPVSQACKRLTVFRVLALLVFVPSMAFAQAQITGTVTDVSGGPMPGVAVEASSSALIEGSRAAVTDTAPRRLA